MNYFIASLFLITGIVNFAPIVGVISVEQLNRGYNIALNNADVILLMRHRAILFGVVGGLILTAAFVHSLRAPATIVGLISMLAFVVLVVSQNTENTILLKIVWIDVVASITLILGYGLHVTR